MSDDIRCAECEKEISFSSARVLSINAAANGCSFETGCHVYLCIECVRSILLRYKGWFR